MDDKILNEMAKEAETKGDNNLAIVLHVFLGAKKAGIGGLFAEHCQDFARSGLEIIELAKLKRN